MCDTVTFKLQCLLTYLTEPSASTKDDDEPDAEPFPVISLTYNALPVFCQ